MPGRNPHPPIALIAGGDFSAFIDTNLFTRGGTTYSISPLCQYRVAKCALGFVHAWGTPNGSPMRLDDDIAASWTGAGTVTMGIDQNDKVYIESDTVDFTIAASASNAYLGFDVAGHGLVGGAAPYRRTAPNDWRRGTVTWTTANQMTITPAASAAFALPSNVGTVQSVPMHFLSPTSQGGFASYSLNAIDDPLATWGVNDSGHVYVTRRTGVVPALSWDSSLLRSRLGFDGTETEVFGANIATLTAHQKLPGAYFPTRPAENVERLIRETTATLDLSSGDISSNHVASIGRWRVVYWVDGPAEAEDTHLHWTEKCVKEHWHRGQYLTFYQHWGDIRTARMTQDVVSAAYGASYTSEANGYRGRRSCRIAADSPNERSATWEQGLRRRFSAELILVDA